MKSTRHSGSSIETELEEANRKLKRQEAELKAAREQLLQQQKLASLGKLTAGIAHEIKNPLNFVNNFSEVSAELLRDIRSELSELKEEVGGASTGSETLEEIEELLNDVESNLEKILEHGRRADGIVKSMLMHSRGKSGERVPTDLNRLLEEYVNLSFHGMRAVDKSFNIDIQTDFDESIGEMELVAQDISRAFLNIINNAMYAAHEQAQADSSREPVIRVTTRNGSDGVVIRIRDNGPGIPDEIRERIFEPFFTTKPTGEGTGLGLSMTHEIIQQHKGSLEVSTETGAFTEFTIKLPKT